MQVPAGTKFEMLTVIREVERSGPNRRFLCQCDCGTETIKFLGNLRMGRSCSCGCVTRGKGEAARKKVMEERRARAQIGPDGRICLTCNRWLPWSRFTRDSRRWASGSGYNSNCMDCGHWRDMKRQFGITRAEWEELLTKQGHRCALCRQYSDKTDRNLAVDHDHKCCGEKKACKRCIRGMLCDPCNRVIGLAERRPLVARRFADYLVQRPFLVAAGDAAAVLEDVPRGVA